MSLTGTQFMLHACICSPSHSVHTLKHESSNPIHPSQITYVHNHQARFFSSLRPVLGRRPLRCAKTALKGSTTKSSASYQQLTESTMFAQHWQNSKPWHGAVVSEPHVACPPATFIGPSAHAQGHPTARKTARLCTRQCKAV